MTRKFWKCILDSFLFAEQRLVPLQKEGVWAQWPTAKCVFPGQLWLIPCLHYKQGSHCTSRSLGREQEGVLKNRSECRWTTLFSKSPPNNMDFEASREQAGCRGELVVPCVITDHALLMQIFQNGKCSQDFDVIVSFEISWPALSSQRMKKLRLCEGKWCWSCLVGKGHVRAQI